MFVISKSPFSRISVDAPDWMFSFQSSSVNDTFPCHQSSGKIAFESDFGTAQYKVFASFFEKMHFSGSVLKLKSIFDVCEPRLYSLSEKSRGFVPIREAI